MGINFLPANPILVNSAVDYLKSNPGATARDFADFYRGKPTNPNNLESYERALKAALRKTHTCQCSCKNCDDGMHCGGDKCYTV